MCVYANNKADANIPHSMHKRLRMFVTKQVRNILASFDRVAVKFFIVELAKALSSGPFLCVKLFSINWEKIVKCSADVL